MNPGRRAKIFSPFDALAGFNERIAEKEVLYERPAELYEDDIAELDRRLAILRGITMNMRMARENHTIVSVRCFVPCTDQNHSAFGTGGQYETVTGMVLRVERDRMIVLSDDHENAIPFNMIREIKGDIFEQESDIYEEKNDVQQILHGNVSGDTALCQPGCKVHSYP